jgi:hypothetical protein
MTLLANYNDSHPERKIRWSSYFVFREHHARSEYEWELISRSGAMKLAVGVENLNQPIRYAIGKKFSNEAIIFHLEQALKHNIRIGLLHVVGYINETQKDIDYIKKWLIENRRFNKIVDHRWGQGLLIYNNTYLGNNKDLLGIKMVGPSLSDWVSEHTDSTAIIRKKWSFELDLLSKRLGFGSSVASSDQHESLESIFLNPQYGIIG